MQVQDANFLLLPDIVILKSLCQTAKTFENYYRSQRVEDTRSSKVYANSVYFLGENYLAIWNKEFFFSCWDCCEIPFCCEKSLLALILKNENKNARCKLSYVYAFYFHFLKSCLKILSSRYEVYFATVPC